MITDAETYFADGCGRCARFASDDCSARRWSAGLAGLRRICREAGLVETAKWGHPCYMAAGRNIALLGAFRDDFRISFMNASLLHDPDGLLEPRGPNTRHPDMIRLTSTNDVARLEPAIRALLAEAVDYAERGIRPARGETEIELPDELIQTLDDDPELAEAFHALTPGRQRSYVILLSSAKTSATRFARIARARDRILAGKGANER